MLHRKEVIYMKFNYSKLRGRIVEKYNTCTAFAKELGVSNRTMSLKMNGKISFSQQEIITVSKLLDIKPNEYGAYFFSYKV